MGFEAAEPVFDVLSFAEDHYFSGDEEFGRNEPYR